jgi:hypothetical protein
MIKNRFYKTTVGVPFELVIGKAAVTAVTNPTFATFVTSSIVGDYQAFVNDGTKIAKGLTAGTALTAAQKKFPVSISYVTEKSGGVCTVVTPTPLLGETIKAVNTVYKAPALQDAKIVKLSGTVQLNQELVFKVIETTPLTNALPSYDYQSTIVVSQVASLAAIVAKINLAAEGEFFTAVAITDGIQIISTDAARHFRLAMNVIPTRAFPINDTNWGYTLTTAAFAGSGTVEQIRSLEFENDVKRGVTTQYPEAGTAAADYGTPISALDLLIAGGTTTFDVVTLTGLKTESAPGPIEQHQNKAYLFIVVPAGQGAAVAAIFA